MHVTHATMYIVTGIGCSQSKSPEGSGAKRISSSILMSYLPAPMVFHNSLHHTHTHTHTQSLRVCAEPTIVIIISISLDKTGVSLQRPRRAVLNMTGAPSDPRIQRIHVHVKPWPEPGNRTKIPRATNRPQIIVFETARARAIIFIFIFFFHSLLFTIAKEWLFASFADTRWRPGPKGLLLLKGTVERRFFVHSLFRLGHTIRRGRRRNRRRGM